jgi:hypothetical protein
MPIPLSEIFISDFPPLLISIEILVALASILFSTSSLITATGQSLHPLQFDSQHDHLGF